VGDGRNGWVGVRPAPPSEPSYLLTLGVAQTPPGREGTAGLYRLRALRAHGRILPRREAQQAASPMVRGTDQNAGSLPLGCTTTSPPASQRVRRGYRAWQYVRKACALCDACSSAHRLSSGSSSGVPFTPQEVAWQWNLFRCFEIPADAL
jgi:hypothetical protein